jgi:hypothetical protein
MPAPDLDRIRRRIQFQIREVESRIRRYTLDPRLSEDRPQDREQAQLQAQANEAWGVWLEVWEKSQRMEEDGFDALIKLEKEVLQINRRADLLQRELIRKEDFHAGLRTVFWLALAMAVTMVLYFLSHGVTGLSFDNFEPLAEWGPLKYIEVAFWSLFGCLCWLLFAATYHLTRRDFDLWYQPWYVTTALRAPFLTVFLMMVVLEFVEWYGEGTWLQSYLLEEGNKFYFIVFTSFSLGLMSEETSAISRELSEGVVAFVRSAATRVSERLKMAISPSGRNR